MFSIRFHGRGGQGVVTAAEMLSVAAFAEGSHAQAFPSFGSERTGAPVVAYCRIADRHIRLREPIQRPDALIVQDPTLLSQVDVFTGLVDGGFVLINSRLALEELDVGRPAGARIVVIPASQIARQHVGRPMPNAALLGGFAALTGRVALPSVIEAIQGRFRGAVADGNVAAAREAHARVLAAVAAAEVKETVGA